MSRVALISGGTSGIGAAIARALQAAGYRVAVNYAFTTDRAETFQKETGIPAFQWDVRDYDACVNGIAQVEETFGPVEVLVNNAGITRDAMFHKMSPQQWREVIDTNLTGVFNMTHPVWPGMRDRGFGRIVNISSINGQKGQAGQANYSASKAGDIGFTKALAQEGASRNITVNAICPGYIGTEMVRAIPEKVLAERIVPQIPVGRLGEPEEIARCVLFLVSDEAGFITGSTMTANGGQYFA
ncbi:MULTISPECIES: acetoacetyl-CoA reductase [Rhizobium/Agrobacterium group]|uniref:Acetoacetyl-CoA reductase n=1 Tax=Agrobacterium tumefaciens TaxID=358 RepID=A0A4D7YU96_AGRTU|nr:MULTISPECIES: acetoacetyl-CoA reductase [Rhizobium/Agrobacterium group]MCZ4074481.1 acetoacetyl-CoA reductase [Agrobacterium sp. LMR679]QCL94902.1 acetoacetyl-CoA reductase [Agrobacterium tumefaciens]TKV77017.1 acetoacetyl-CoA reductase [Rhizobium sp. AU243]